MNRFASALAPHATLSFSSASSSKFDHPADKKSAFPPASPAARRHRPIRKAAPGVALFAPIHYERRYAYPLLIWLHAEGSSERELRQLMPNVSVRNYVGAAGRGAPLSRDPSAGYSWAQTPDGIDAAHECVLECIEHARRSYHVHSERIFLAGHGSGGTMALRLALATDLPLAGAVSMGGPLPRGHRVLARVNEVRTRPLMLMCCRESRTYPSQQVADDLRLLHSAGCQLAIREYLCGDELFSDMFADMDAWLMERVCQPTAAATVS